MLAEHHRKMAFEKNDEKTIPAFVRDVDDDTAVMIVTETNLKKREKLLPSEKAWAYRMQLEAIKRQGKRSDLAEKQTSAHNEQKLNSRDMVAEENNVDKNEIQRYVRLSYLVNPLLDLTDDNKLSLLTGVDISYLDEHSQLVVHKFFFVNSNEKKLDTKLSALIREEFNRKKSIDDDDLKRIIASDTKKPEKPKPFTISRKEFSGYDIPNDKELKRLFIEFLNAKFKQK